MFNLVLARRASVVGPEHTVALEGPGWSPTFAVADVGRLLDDRRGAGGAFDDAGGRLGFLAFEEALDALLQAYHKVQAVADDVQAEHEHVELLQHLSLVMTGGVRKESGVREEDVAASKVVWLDEDVFEINKRGARGADEEVDPGRQASARICATTTETHMKSERREMDEVVIVLRRHRFVLGVL